MSVSFSRPFRTKLHCVPNPEGHHPANLELQEMESPTVITPEDSAILRWIRHPDERVVLACIERFFYLVYSSYQGALKDRLNQLLTQEPGIWSPLLDRGSFITSVLTDAHRARLARWFRDANADEMWDFFSTFACPQLAWIAAKTCRDWTPDLVRVLTNRNPAVLKQIATNKHFTDAESSIALFECSMAVLTSGRRHESRDAAGAITTLTRKGKPVPENWVDKLIPLIRDPRVGRFAATAVSNARDLSEEQAREALIACNRRGDVVAALVAGPALSMPIVKDALKWVPRLPVRRAVARRTELLTDPEIREILGESDCARVLTALIKTATTPEDASALFQKLSRSHPLHALHVLERYWPAERRVPSSAVAAILACQKSMARERMLTLLSQIGIEAAPTTVLPLSAEPKSRPRGRSR